MAHQKSMKLIVGAVLALAGASMAAAANAAEVCKPENIAIVRLSKITAGGTMEGFKKAVAANAAWYPSHGYPKDKILLMPVLNVDQQSKQLSESSEEVMTIHLHASMVPSEKHDKAWDSFVADFRANSDLVSTKLVCMPKH